MDAELSALRRRYEANPADPEAAGAYEAALRRAGEHDTLDGLYRLAYGCPLAWDALDGDEYDTARHCARCERPVYYVQSRAEMARWVAQGECVALDPERLRETLPVLVDAPHTDPAPAPGRPCLVEVTPGSEPQRPEGIRGRFVIERPPQATRAEKDAGRALLRALPRRDPQP